MEGVVEALVVCKGVVGLFEGDGDVGAGGVLGVDFLDEVEVGGVYGEGVVFDCVGEGGGGEVSVPDGLGGVVLVVVGRGGFDADEAFGEEGVAVVGDFYDGLGVGLGGEVWFGDGHGGLLEVVFVFMIGDFGVSVNRNPSDWRGF